MSLVFGYAVLVAVLALQIYVLFALCRISFAARPPSGTPPGAGPGRVDGDRGSESHEHPTGSPGGGGGQGRSDPRHVDKSGVRPRTSRSFGCVLQVFSGVVLLVGAALLKASPGGGLVTHFVLGPLNMMLVFGGIVAALGSRGKRHRAPSAGEKLGSDPRPPVLLLRSFRDDGIRLPRRTSLVLDAVGRKSVLGETVTFEEVLERCLDRVGPVIAIGRPGEELPRLGAARDYVADASWQDYVKHFSRESRFIVLLLGSTGGVTWEILRLAESGLLAKTILAFPPVGEGELERRWEAAVGSLAASAGPRFPPALPAGSLVATFDVGGALEFVRGDGERTVQAFEDAVKRAIAGLESRGKVDG